MRSLKFRGIGGISEYYKIVETRSGEEKKKNHRVRSLLSEREGLPLVVAHASSSSTIRSAHPDDERLPTPAAHPRVHAFILPTCAVPFRAAKRRGF